MGLPEEWASASGCMLRVCPDSHAVDRAIGRKAPGAGPTRCIGLRENQVLEERFSG
jgi:hypothetical protein